MPVAKKTETQQANPENTAQNLLNKNVRFYARVKDVPVEAQKSFDNGRFKGTDINPMWRIQMLTELFGPCGFGWWTQNVKYSFVEADVTPLSQGNDPSKRMETSVFCELELIVKDPETGEVSQPIYGVGGNTYIAWGKSGPRASDEAEKMAYTDALSIACKSLGFGHNIWYQNDKTKYTINDVSGGTPAAKKPAETAGLTDEAADLINKISEKLSPLKNMTREQKQPIVNDILIPTIGGDGAYKTCKDVAKLTACLNKLTEYFENQKAA